jgi:hypothetical protein
MEDFYSLNVQERVACTREARERNEPLSIRWANAQRIFNERWQARAVAAAEWLADASSVADIGCGTMTLETCLRPGQLYLPVDLARRDERTVVLDINRAVELSRLPAAHACALLGVLEYAYRPRDLLRAIRNRYRQVVVSFNFKHENQSIEARLANGWVNHFTCEQFLALFFEEGFVTARERCIAERRHEYIFDIRAASC